MSSIKSVQIDHLNFTVKNLQESLEWYERIFAFKKVEGGVRNGEAWAIVRSGDLMLCMYEAASKPAEDAAGWHSGPVRIWHFGLRIHDQTAWEQTVKDNNIHVEYDGAVRYPHSLSWYISDPSGHEIEVSYWDDDTVRFS